MAFAAQASLLLQLCTVWPLILGLIRSMIFEITTGVVWPSTPKVVGLVVGYIGASTFGTVVLHKVVGTVLSYIAAGSGIVYIYLLPFLVGHDEIMHGTPEALSAKLLDDQRNETINSSREKEQMHQVGSGRDQCPDLFKCLQPDEAETTKVIDVPDAKCQRILMMGLNTL